MRDLRPFARLLQVIAPIGWVATAGCSSPIGDFDERVCIDERDGLRDLRPRAGVDWVARRTSVDGSSGGILSEWGEECAHATDPVACAEAVAQLPVAPPLVDFERQDGVIEDVAFTAGDELGRVATASQLVALLGRIDTPADAALIALGNRHRITCDENNVRREGDGFVLLATRGDGCPSDIEHYELTVTADGAVTAGESEVAEAGDPHCIGGRRPAALRTRTRRATSVGHHFENLAHLEAASVPAFEQLAVELAAHGAPAALVAAAIRARDDEIRHAAAMARFARRFGARPSRPVVGPRRIRTLFEVALDNATEGCARETLGALLATVQARSSIDPSIRRALGSIARDETRHAALAWATDAWLRARLDARARRAIAEAQDESFAALRRDLEGREPDTAVRAVAGVPSAEASVALLEALRRRALPAGYPALRAPTSQHAAMKRAAPSRT